MEQLLEMVVVGVIVAACAVSSIWRLLSIRLRIRALEALSFLPAAAGGSFVARLRQSTLQGLSGGCGACVKATTGATAKASRAVSGNVQPLNQKPGAPRR